MLILRLHYFGEKAKILFKTTGVFMILLILIAAFQATGISFFLAKLFTGKAMEILRIAFNFVPQDTYRFALAVSFGFALVYEFIILVFSRNGQQRYAIAFTALVILLSLASYIEIIKDAVPYLVLGFDIMKVVPLFIAFLPAAAHYVIAEGLVNKSISFTQLSNELIKIETDMQDAEEKISGKSRKKSSVAPRSPMPNTTQASRAFALAD
jgi:hypothetical protein